MRVDMKKIGSFFLLLIKIGLVGLPLIALWLYCIFGKMDYMDDEYPYYRWIRDQIHSSHEDVDVIILGDSAMNSALDPELLSNHTLSLATGGGQPADAYYILKEYLEHNEAPKVVYVGYQQINYDDYGVYWERSFYSHIYDYEDALDVIRTAEAMGTSEILVDHYRRKLLSYYIDFPGVYGKAVVNSGINGRRVTNEEAYNEIGRHDGHYICWDSADEDANHYIVNYDDFMITGFRDEYFHRLINLCNENGITCRLLSLPCSPGRDYTENFQASMDSYYTDLCKLGDDVTYLSNTMDADFSEFADTVHFNMRGTQHYSELIRNTYPEDFSDDAGTSSEVLREYMTNSKYPSDILHLLNNKDYAIVLRFRRENTNEELEQVLSGDYSDALQLSDGMLYLDGTHGENTATYNESSEDWEVSDANLGQVLIHAWSIYSITIDTPTTGNVIYGENHDSDLQMVVFDKNTGEMVCDRYFDMLDDTFRENPVMD